MEIDWKKQYEEVLAKARAGKNLGEIFPELKEIEDGKIREEIVSFIRAFWVDHRYSVPQTSKWLDWLEKQKEPKQEWGEEEEQWLDDAIYFLESAKSHYADPYEIEATINWLKSIKNRGNFSKSNTNSPSWSEADDRHRLNCLSYFSGIAKSSPYYEDYLWLKFLKNRVDFLSWKPSEEQMEALEWMLTTVTMKDGGFGVVLKNLVNDLKKLM